MIADVADSSLGDEASRQRLEEAEAALAAAGKPAFAALLQATAALPPGSVFVVDVTLPGSETESHG
jgi:inactivated superfamily I helicase